MNSSKPIVRKSSNSSVDRIYERLKQMAMNYKFRPGEPLNEVELAASFGVSRTPLREVLNRLVAEGLLDFVPRRGFSCRALDTKMIFDLYEVRCGLEMMSAKLATERATDAEVSTLVTLWKTASQKFGELSPLECAQCDERFHEQIATLSRNAELLHSLQAINARAHYLRLISMEKVHYRHNTCDEHQLILKAIQKRNVEAAVNCMSAHVSLRQEQLVEVIKEGIARLYMT
ncbi:GntR family transcriptional regulator [Gloeocapsopsis crepidinum LEGE 06123]|uniref:GntR family transcriptional regulator n=2 Tax=Gloeocapsopsis crepidinum TaxID=693223 RepID=A0ABR9UTJ0_9CHRO|nr:GntR family transcriptional regulator [Gloeocapsopsis crepidinum LEGE 06123]